MKASTLRWLIVIALIALWEILPRAGVIPELFLPSLSSTLAAGWNEAGEYGEALAVTLYEVAISMAFACGGGILLGAIVGSLPRPRLLIMPMVSSLYAVPLVILYPVFTVWLGIGYLISRYRTILDSPHVFAGVLLVLAMAIAFNAFIRLLERKAAIWQTGTRGGQRATEEIAPGALQPAT